MVLDTFKNLPKLNKDIITLTSELVRIPSINSNDINKDIPNIHIMANFIKDWLVTREIDAQIKIFDNYPVVIAEIGKGKKTIMLNGHMDVVPIGDKTKWSIDPFLGRIIGDRIYGRGTTDMKSGLSIFMKLLVDMNKKLDYKIIFTAVSDEETGGHHCSKKIAEYYNPDLVLISEPTCNNIAIGEKGIFTIKLMAEGKSAHSSLPSTGKNAILLMMKDLKSLSRIQKLVVKNPEQIKDILRDSNKLYSYDANKITFNPAIISGGTKANMVPDCCNTIIDMRLPPGISTERVLKITESYIANSKIIAERCVEPSYTDPNNPYLVKFLDVSRLSGNLDTNFFIFTGGTDAKYFRYKNIPTIIYGPGDLKLAHSYDEYVTFDQLKIAFDTYNEFLSKI